MGGLCVVCSIRSNQARPAGQHIRSSEVLAARKMMVKDTQDGWSKIHKMVNEGIKKGL